MKTRAKRGKTRILEHHGVKGQKWGVRRYQNIDGTLTSLGKARKKTINNLNTMTLDDVDSLIQSGKDFCAKADLSLYRIDSKNSNGDVNIKYVTARKEDVPAYKSMRKTYYPDDEQVQKEYKSKEILNIAGARTQLELLSRLSSENLPADFNKMSDADFSNYFKTNKEILKLNLDLLNSDPEDPKVKSYISELSKRGYNAVVDLVDTSIGYSHAPLAVINPKDKLKEHK